MIPTFEEQRAAWSSPPVDDVGYVPSRDMLELSDEQLRTLIVAMGHMRYSGWRNHENRWRSLFKLDETVSKVVLDYGCGVGLESLQYALLGNFVIVADIVPENIELARRVCKLMSLHGASDSLLLDEHPPKDMFVETIDVIHCVGVLHHIPNWQEVIEAFERWLTPDGEVRLMLYSDIAYRDAKGDFANAMDGVGSYADWYDLERVKLRFGQWFRVERSAYLTKNRHYLGVVLRKRYIPGAGQDGC